MKNIALVLATIVLFAGTFTSCRKANTQAPTMVLIGSANIIHSLNASFSDLGATATDQEGKILTVKVTCSPAFNKDLVGTYVFTYSCYDIDGNTAEITRTVIVQNDAIGYAGAYDATGDRNTDGTIDNNWVETISVSPTVNNRIIFSQFAYYTGASPYADLYANYTAINLPQQLFTCGTPQVDRSLSGTGTVDADTPITITINYVEISDATYTGVDVFTKQQ